MLFAPDFDLDDSSWQSGREAGWGDLDTVAEMPILRQVPDVDLRAMRAIGVITLPALLRPIEWTR